MKTFLNKLPIVAMFFSTLILTACGGGDSGGAFTPDYNANNMTRIDVTASPVQVNGISAVTIPAGFSQPVQATAHYLDGTTKDITSQAIWAVNDENICTYSAELGVTGVVAGECSIHATLDGMTSNNFPITISQAVLTSLQLSSNKNTLPKGETAKLTATGTFSDKTTMDITNNVIWNLGTPAVLSVNNSGTLSADTVGTSTIIAQQNGIDSNSASITVTDAVIKTIQVSPASISLAKGNTNALTATAIFSDNTTSVITDATWSVTSESVATIASNTISAVGVGATTFTAEKSGVTSNQASITVTAAELVGMQISSPKLDIASGIAQGLKTQLSAVGVYSDRTTKDITNDVTWTPVSASIASVSATGELTAVGTGDTTITATPKAASQRAVTSNSLAVKVIAKKVTAIAITSADTATTTIPSTLVQGLDLNPKLKATATYTDATTADITSTAAWISTNTGVASVTVAGSQATVKGEGVGATVITANLDGITSNNISLSVTAATITALKIREAGSTANITTKKIILGNGANLQAWATFTNNAAYSNITDNVDWTSSATAVATVETKGSTLPGKVTSVTAGTSEIKASISGSEATVALTVDAAEITGIQATLNSGNAIPTNTAVGLSHDLKVTASYTDGTSVTVTDPIVWTPSNDVVSVTPATASTAAKLTANKVGTSEVTATVSGHTTKFSITVTTATITGIEVKLADGSNVPANIAKGLTAQLIARVSLSDASSVDITNATWSAITTGATTPHASVSPAGLLAANTEGATTITATVGGITSTAVNITVVAPIVTDIIVTLDDGSPVPSNIAKGLTTQLKAVEIWSDGRTPVDVTSTATWASGTSTNITVSDVAGTKGLLTAVAEGSSVITASASSVTSTNITVTVSAPLIVGIKITPPTPATIAPSGTLNLEAKNVLTDSTEVVVNTGITWSSSDTAIATVNATTGAVRALAGATAGQTVVISVTRDSDTNQKDLITLTIN